MDVQEIKECFAENFKRLRKQKNLTQATAAECVGIEPHNWNRLENAKSFPKVETLANIANYFEVSPSELFRNFETRAQLRDSIDEILNKHPDKTKEFYNILLAITN